MDEGLSMIPFEPDSEPTVPFSRSVVASAVLAFISILLLVLAILLFFKSSYSNAPIEFSTGNVSGDVAKENKPIVVDVAGAVNKPGIYRVEEGARVGDLLDKAGGFSNDADIQWVEKAINRATKVTDGMKLYVLRKGEVSTSHNFKVANDASITSHNENSGYPEVAGTTGISINLASKVELESLPGIGPVTADTIINGRPYGSIVELVEKKIVKPSVYEQIKDMVSL